MPPLTIVDADGKSVAFPIPATDTLGLAICHAHSHTRFSTDEPI